MIFRKQIKDDITEKRKSLGLTKKNMVYVFNKTQPLDNKITYYRLIKYEAGSSVPGHIYLKLMKLKKTKLSERLRLSQI